MLRLRNRMNNLFSIWLLCGLLTGAAGMALIAWYLYSPSGSPSQVVFPSEVCDVMPLDKPTRADSGYFMVRFVAYGDVDVDDDGPCRMLPDVRIAIIHHKESGLISWWEAVGGNELGIGQFMPLGARVPSTAEKLSNAPARFVTTGPDGTAEIIIPHDQENEYSSLCAISPIENLVAGCSHHFSLWDRRDNHVTAYIYFTHGHAIIERRTSDRYQQYIDDSRSSQGPATVAFTAQSYDDIAPTQPYRNMSIVFVSDAHVDDWWTAVWTAASDNQTVMQRKYSSPVDSDVLAHDWVHVITTGPDGLAEKMLVPGDYLICALNYYSNSNRSEPICLYENLAGGHHQFQVSIWDGGTQVHMERE